MTSGFFQQQLDPNYRLWYSDQNIRHIQTEVMRRLSQKYIERIMISFDQAKSALDTYRTSWNGPLTLDELLEGTICDIVKNITIEIDKQSQFSHFEPRTLYFPNTDLTMQEKVKINSRRPKMEFQMRY